MSRKFNLVVVGVLVGAMGLSATAVVGQAAGKGQSGAVTAEATSDSGACPVPGAKWAEVSPLAAAGWSKEKLAAAREYAESIHSAGVVIVQHGKVVEEWGDVDGKLASFSMRKSLLSALYGIYSAEGKIDINETLGQLGISDSPDPLTKEEQQARIVDLLRARSGVYHAVDFETDSMKRSRPARGSHAPGTFWYYNNWDFNTVGTIFEKETGLSIGEAFDKRIAKPIGMQDFSSRDVYYLPGPESTQRGYMFEITARDLARFGQLYLCHGRWGDRQIIPAEWVAKSSHSDEMIQVGKYKLGGYEYLWWVEHDGALLGPATLPGMFAAEGAGGHYVLIIPTLDMVIVNRFANEPKNHEVKSVVAAAQVPGIYEDQFGKLVTLILDANTAGAEAESKNAAAK
jgi:CubicO group peptidase (beta-lactamase class C family)